MRKRPSGRIAAERMSRPLAVQISRSLPSPLGRPEACATRIVLSGRISAGTLRLWAAATRLECLHQGHRVTLAYSLSSKLRSSGVEGTRVVFRIEPCRPLAKTARQVKVEGLTRLPEQLSYTAPGEGRLRACIIVRRPILQRST